MPHFRLAMHPASEGDALVLSWNDGSKRRRALIDLGRMGDYRRLRDNGVAAGAFDLFAITHIDADHIEGTLPLVKERTAPFTPAEVWFNGYHHLRNAGNRLSGALDREGLSAAQAEKLSDGIIRFGWPWNRRFTDGIISVDAPECERPFTLAGLTVTLLSPSDAKLAKLESRWPEELKAAGLRRGDADIAPPTEIDEDLESLSTLNVEKLASERFVEDSTPANGSSIAFLAEFQGRRILLAGDAHPSVLEASLRKLGHSETNRIELHCFKMSHHGSKKNLSPSLLKVIDCTRFAFSTDGTRHHHPDPQTIARILVNDPSRDKIFYFNFRQDSATVWDENRALKNRYRYACEFPPAAGEAIEFGI